MRDSGYRLFGPGPAVEDHGNGAAAVGGIETLSRFGLADLGGTSGQLWVSYVTAVTSGPIGRLMIATGNGAGASITLARIALFTVAADGGSITKVAQTANDATIGAATFTSYDRAFSTAGGFPAQYVITRGRRYALGWLQVAGTASNVQGAFATDAATPPIATRIIGSQTDIAASYAIGSLPAHWAMAYIRGLPPAS